MVPDFRADDVVLLAMNAAAVDAFAAAVATDSTRLDVDGPRATRR